MSRTFVVILIVGLAAVAAHYSLYPAARSPAANRLFAAGGFAFLVLALLELAWEGLRRRQAARKGGGIAETLLDPENRRETFRIPYPEGERPTLALADRDTTFEVLDLSEEGASFAVPAGAELRGAVHGELFLPGGEKAAIAGKVVRCREGVAGLRLTRALPAGLLLGEQRRLRDHLRRATPPRSAADSGSAS